MNEIELPPHSRLTLPSRPLLGPNPHSYVKSEHTDLRKTFLRVQRKAEAEKDKGELPF